MRSLSSMIVSVAFASSSTCAFNVCPRTGVGYDARSRPCQISREAAISSRFPRRHSTNAHRVQATRVVLVTALGMSSTETAVPVAGEADGATSDEVDDVQTSVDIPTSLPSESGIDYVPLATMLATGDLKGADQFTRDALIKAAGAGSQKRDFVYWTEVKKIPK